MAHTIHVVEVKELSDDQVSYKTRCCGEVKTDSCCTIHVSVPEAEHDATLQAHKDRQATIHEHKVNWRKKVNLAPPVPAVDPNYKG